MKKNTTKKTKSELILQMVTPTASSKKSNGTKKTNGNGVVIGKNSRNFETRFIPRYDTMPNAPDDLETPTFSEASQKILKERYLLKGGNLEAIETISDRFWHMAYDIASADFDFGATKDEVYNLAKKFYGTMVRQEFLPNSPTIMNAGKQNQLQYSACFVLPVDDDISSIFDTMKYAALIHQTGGGTGFAFSRLRPSGSRVRRSGGVASGPIPFLRAYDAATQAIKQGGTRRGANMGILRVDHPNVLDFIRCKSELDDQNQPIFEGVAPLLPDDDARKYFKTLLLDRQISNFNISVAITDRFMEAYYKGEDYDLIDPHTRKVTGKLNAKAVFDEMCERAWATGDPGCVFIDRINASRANPVPDLEEIESTNPCVTGDTLVSTADGWRRVDEIKAGDKIGTVLGGGVVERVEVYEDRPVYKVKFSDGSEIRVTRAHQFHAIKAQGRSKNAANKRFTPLMLADLAVGDVVRVYPGIMPDRAVPDLPTGWLEKDYGFFVGMLLGDGCITPKTLNRNVVKIAVNIGEIEWVAKVKEVLHKTGSKVITTDVSARSYSANLTVQDANGAALLVRQSLLTPSFSYEKRIPLEYQNTNRQFLAGLLDGLFSTDGNVNLTSSHPALRFKTTSKQLALDVRRILLNFGIHGRIATIPEVKEGHIGERKIISKHTQYEVNISGYGVKIFTEQIGLSHPDKQKRLQIARQEFALTGNTWITKIISIEPDGAEKVYDLYEPNSDTWITEGLVSRGCGEQPLGPFDACNLGSINLGKFVLNGGSDVDWGGLKRVTREAVHFLDNVVQTNPYTLPQIYDEVHKNRRIGLGVMGWADMLFKLKIPYDSDEAIVLAEKVMDFITDEGVKKSEELAIEKGPFPNWSKSRYKNGKLRRNGTVTTIAPTGTISIIGDCSSGIEPVFALAYIHRAKGDGGKTGNEMRILTIANKTFTEIAQKEGFWSENLAQKVMDHGSVSGIDDVPADWQRVFVTAPEISPEYHVRMQAAYQKGTENGVSKTINLPNSATVEDVKTAYLLAWETGCNGITVYRDGSKTTQVLNVSTKLDQMKKQQATDAEVVTDVEVREGRPMILRGRTYKIMTPVGRAYMTVNRDENDRPFEVFITVGKGGMHTMADAEAIGRLASISLRVAKGYRLEVAQEIIQQLRGIGGSSHIGFGKERVMSLADAVAKVLAEDIAMSEREEEKQPEELPLQLVEESASKKDDVVTKPSSFPLMAGADLCPECGEATFVREDGCEKCYSCGFSKC